MFTELYVEALLADQELADQVWGLWDAGLIPDELAAIAWGLVALENISADPTSVECPARKTVITPLLPLPANSH